MNPSPPNNPSTDENARLLIERERLAQQRQIALDAASMGWWHYDPITKISTWDDRYKEIFGLTGNQLLNDLILARIFPEDLPLVWASVEAALDPLTPRPYHTEFRIKHDDGATLWIEAHGLATFEGEGSHRHAVSFVGTVADITPRKQADEERRELANRYSEQSRTFERVLSSITDFAYTFDLHGRFTFANKPLLDLWGLNLPQAVGKNFFQLHYPEDLAAKLQQQIQQVIQTRERIIDETPYTNPNGSAGYYQYILSPVIGPDGTVEAVAGSTRDYTDQKLAEKERETLLENERLARAEADAANRAKDKFLAVLSHELRTPLSPIALTVPAMEADPDLPPKFREELAMIRRNIELEVKLIDDLLDLSRVTSGKLRIHMQPVHAHEVLLHAIHNSLSDTAGKRFDIRQNLHAANDFLTGDPARLQQVFWNLLRNAVKFTPDGGDITVRTWNESNSPLLFVEIKDSGEGIPAEILPRIFDAFEQGDARVTRQFGGLGLGLAIAKAVVEMHGGSLTAASPGRGKGATFTVQLQNTKETLTTPAHNTGTLIPARITSRPARILLVEDHLDTARTFARLLTTSGFIIKVAHSAASALQLAAAEPFDILVSDIGLPDASGYELIKQLQSLYGMKGIALSGYGMEDDIRKSREAGFSEHLVKPVNIPHFEATLRRILSTI